MTTPLHGCFLFIGPDRVRQRERLEAIAHAIPVAMLDRHELDAAHLKALALAAATRERPISSPSRLVVIDQAQRLDAACVKLLAEQMPTLTSTTCLVLMADGELEAKHPLRALDAQATVERFPWLSADEVAGWVQRYLASQEKRLAPAAMQELLAYHGPDLAGIRGTLDQLIAWIGARPQIGQADCREFFNVAGGARTGRESGRGDARGGFALAELIGRRNAAAALRTVQEQLDLGRDVLELLGLIIWQVQRWLTVSRLQEAGIPRGRIESMSGIKTWQLERMQPELAGRSAEWLGRMMERCRQLDVAIKTGRTIPRIGLEALVVGLCLVEKTRTPSLAVRPGVR